MDSCDSVYRCCRTPVAPLRPLMVALSIIAIIYGAYMALAQVDLKKLIAYSSVSHMGFVTLGLFMFNKQGIEGAVLQMVNHGITTGALFLCVGMIYERTHSRLIADNVGLASADAAVCHSVGDFRLVLPRPPRNQ